MIIAIASQGDTFEATIDKRFSRCRCFVFYNTDTKGIEFLPNYLREQDSEVGQAAVELLYKKGVSKVISGDFGEKIKPLLDSKKIQMIVYKEETITLSKLISFLQKTYL